MSTRHAADAVFNLDFPHAYDLEECRELPPAVSTVKHFYFPGGSEIGGQDGLLLRIRPHEGNSWLGTFAFGSFRNGVTGVYTCPDSESLCVISAGEGYVVNVHKPSMWVETKVYPVIDVRILRDESLLVFSDFTHMAAYGPNGHIWTTPQLSSDGLEILEVTKQYIAGRAWDAPNQRNVEFRVDLKTGEPLSHEA